MNTILAKRNLANKQNTAQSNVNRSIERLVGSARETEYVLPMMPLHGEVNLAALSRINVKSIITKESGKITDVRGLPEGLSKFTMPGQLLIEINSLPKSLETLNLDDNFIEHIDLSRLERLKVLSINNNQLKTLGELPPSLEELYIDNNAISRLNLNNLERLRVLHCRNNKTLRIENIPASMMDLRVEEGNPHIMLDYAFIPSTTTSEDGRRAIGTETEFVEALHKYFALKSKYEEGARVSRMAAREAALKRGLGENQAKKMVVAIRPKCVNCKRRVGSVFKTREDRLLAYCGDANSPCALRIEIFKSRFESDDAFAESTRNVLLDTKDRIIRQKMDVLFNYASEEETVSKFKDLIEEYNLYSFLHKTDMDMREDKRFNAHKKELMKVKMQRLNQLKSSMNSQIDEYNESENRDVLHAAMDIYIREYLPEMHNLRMMKYGVMEMLTPEPDTPVRVLNQSAASVRQLETLHGEVPRVLKFTVGKENDSLSREEEDDLAEDDVESNVVPFESDNESD